MSLDCLRAPSFFLSLITGAGDMKHTRATTKFQSIPRCCKGLEGSITKSILFCFVDLPDGNVWCILLVRSDNA